MIRTYRAVPVAALAASLLLAAPGLGGGTAAAQSCPVYAIGTLTLTIVPDCPEQGTPPLDLGALDPPVPVALVGLDEEGALVPIGIVGPPLPSAPADQAPAEAAATGPEPSDAAPPSASDEETTEPASGEAEDPGEGCNPAYVECLPIVEDLDCESPELGGRTVQLVDVDDDPYDLDVVNGPGNTVGCDEES